MQDLTNSTHGDLDDMVHGASSEPELPNQFEPPEKEIEAIRQQVDMLTTQLGQQTMALFRQGQLEVPKVAETCQQLAQLEERLAVLEEEKQKLSIPDSLIVTCASCGGDVRAGAHFCSHCGTSMADEEAAEVLCQDCGQKIIAGASFCNRCGAPTAQEDAVEHIPPDGT